MAVKPGEGGGIGVVGHPRRPARAGRGRSGVGPRRTTRRCAPTRRATTPPARGGGTPTRAGTRRRARIDPRPRDGQGGRPLGAAVLRRPRAALGARPVPRAGHDARGVRDRRPRPSWATCATASSPSTTSPPARSRCRATAPSRASRVTVGKTIRLLGDRLAPELVIDLELHHRGDAPIDARLGLELSLHLLGGGGNPSAWYDVGGDRSAHDGSGAGRGRRGDRLRQRLGGRRGRGPPEPAADAWWSPIETVSNSESGFERVYQGSSLLLSWPLRLAPGESRRFSVRQAVSVARDRAAEAEAQRARVSHVRRGPPLMSRGRLVVHAHFYQPLRVDPFTGRVPEDASAAPFRDWNERITEECYRPIAERGTPAHISWNMGPTLTGVPRPRGAGGARGVRGGRPRGRRHRDRPGVPPLDPAARGARTTGGRRSCGGCATSRCGSAARRRRCGCPRPRSTSRRSGVAGGRRASQATILAPWQADVETPRHPPAVPGRRRRRPPRHGRVLRRRPVGRGLVRAGGDGRRRPLRTRARSAPRLGGALGPRAATPTARHRDRRRAVRPPPVVPRPVPPAARRPGGRGSGPRLRRRRPRTRPSPSPTAVPTPRSGSGTARRGAATTASCAGPPSARTSRTADGRRPLRAALERLAGGIDAVTDALARDIPGLGDPWAARDRYVDVVIGAVERRRVRGGLLGRRATAGRPTPAARADRGPALATRDVRLGGWYWDDPSRPETRQVLRSAARRPRLVDRLARHGPRDAARRRPRRRSARPPSTSTGGAIYRHALSEVGQPPPRGLSRGMRRSPAWRANAPGTVSAADRPQRARPSGGHELDIERGSDVPISTQIYWQLAYQIESGRLQPGTRLPPVRELGAALRVNPNTVRAVYRRLADAGYVVGRHGAGTRVVDRPPVRRGSDALAGIVAETLRRAAQLGFTPDEVAQATFTAATERKRPGPLVRVLFAECTSADATFDAERIVEAFPDRVEADGRAARGAPRAARALPLRPGRHDDVPRRRGAGLRRRRACPWSRCSSGPGYMSLVHEVAGLPPGSKVGLVCGSQRGVENIAEVLQLAGATGRRDRVGGRAHGGRARPRGPRRGHRPAVARGDGPRARLRGSSARSACASGATSSTRRASSSCAARSSASTRSPARPSRA